MRGGRQCRVCGRPYDPAGYLGPPEPPDHESSGMCPPCADAALAAERDRRVAEGPHALALQWEEERRRLRAVSPRWFPWCRVPQWPCECLPHRLARGVDRLKATNRHSQSALAKLHAHSGTQQYADSL